MGFLDNFIERDKKEETPAVSSKKNAAPVYVPPTTISSKISTSSENVNKYAAEFQQMLHQVYVAGNFPGPDYFELMNGVTQLNGVIPDERAKFIAGFTMLKQSGQLDKNKLLTTAAKYIELLNAEKIKFKNDIAIVIDRELGSKNKQLANFKAENDNIEKQLKALMDKKAQNDKAYSELEAEINEDREVLSAKENGFELAANAAIGEIQENITKIQNYIS